MINNVERRIQTMEEFVSFEPLGEEAQEELQNGFDLRTLFY